MMYSAVAYLQGISNGYNVDVVTFFPHRLNISSAELLYTNGIINHSLSSARVLAAQDWNHSSNLAHAVAPAHGAPAHVANNAVAVEHEV